MNQESRIKIKFKKQIAFLFFCSAILLSFAPKVLAADLFLLPETGEFKIGEEFSIDVKIDSDNVSINASQAEIRFPNSILELTKVEIQDSVFNFWVEEPTFSNDTGILTFIGGTAKGVSGASLQVLKMRFKAKGSGKGEITMSDAVVTANDGKGTNVLSLIRGGSVAVGTEVVKPIAPPEPEVVEKPIEQPKKIIREAVLAKNLPEAPKLRVPLYPDETKWYNKQGEVIVLWELPDDIIEVATRVSQTKDKKSGEKEEELFTGKNLGILEEGVWYVRVQFRNNVGWGELAYYKISLDNTAPLPFEINMDNLVSDNPSPNIVFETQDGFSGISHALIYIDGKDSIRATSTSFKIPPQEPGSHNMVIRIFDMAGNSIEDDISFEILPLPTPTIDFVTKKVSQGDIIFISGSSIPNSFANIKIFRDSQEVFNKMVDTNDSGNWEMVIDELFKKGNYTLSVVTRDDRGAVSYPTELQSIRITSKTVLTLGFADLSWFEIFVIAILLFLAIGASVAWYYIKEREKGEAYKIIVSRDIKKISKLVEDNLKELEDLHEGTKTFTPATKTQANTMIAKMKMNVGKMKKYLSAEIEKLK